MFKKWISGAIMLITFLSLVPAASAFEYKDVVKGSSYFYSIDYLRRNDVFKDTQYFYPNKLITKAEFIKYLVILNNPDFVPTGKETVDFKDARKNAWYTPYLAEAVEMGILDKRDITVEPDGKLTLVDALELLFHSVSIPIPNRYIGGIPYSDVERNERAAPIIMRALTLDLIVPQRNDYVGIYRRITRAEAARMIYKMDLATLGATSGSTGIGSLSAELQKIVGAWELVESSYIGRSDIDRVSMADKAIRSFIEDLGDPYSTYMDKEENEQFSDDLDGELEGIGAAVGYNDDGNVTIVSPLKNSPAEKAGIQSGDVIHNVDGTSTIGMELSEAVSLIKGPKGTPVVITIKRGERMHEITVIRDLIIVENLEVEMIENGKILKMTLSQFGPSVAEEFNLVANQIVDDPSIMGLIIDLRNNPGGLLSAAVSMLNQMVIGQAEIVTIKYTDFDQTIYSRGRGKLIGFPIVVLINGGSASASEILAGALKDYDLATIVGETSFGKGTVQEVNYFLDNSSLKLTVARWLTPLGSDIQESGVDPDVFVKNPSTTQTDEQMNRAITELYKLMK